MEEPVIVEPGEGGAPFNAVATQVVLLTQIPQFQPGQVVTVRYAPKDPSNVAIKSLGHVRYSESDAARIINEGQALFDRLNASATSVSALAIVRTFKPTGVSVNGDNPLAEVSVKVLPAGEAPFDASMVAVFGVEGLHKYQPGQEVHVRFEPSDPKQVTIDAQKTKIEVSNP